MIFNAPIYETVPRPKYRAAHCLAWFCAGLVLGVLFDAYYDAIT